MPSRDGQWIFPAEVMLHTPSVNHGLSVVEERCRRAKGVNFIIQAAALLKIPQITISTASIYFHRFYMRFSLDPDRGGFHHYPIAATALFLATKAEENCRKTKEIVICVAKVAQKNTNLIIDEQSKEFWRWKDNILQFEETMLEALTFDIHIDSPYRLISSIFEMFGLLENRELRNIAWSFLNDSAMTHLGVVQPARDIAVAALFFALAHSGESLPDDEQGRQWWKQAGGDAERIAQAVDIMYDLYEDNPLGKKENPYERSPSDSSESKLERTRQRHENGNGIDSQSHSEIDTPGASGGIATPDIHTAKTHVNGNGITKEDGEVTPNGKARSESHSSSDEKLQEAANDSATHENTAIDSATVPPVTNGTSTDYKPSPPATTPKRKAAEISSEPPETNSDSSKRSRLENGTSVGGNGTTSSKSDEEEEGELEE